MERIKIKVKIASGLSKKLPHSIERITKYIGESALEVNEKESAIIIEVMLKSKRMAVTTRVMVVTFLKSSRFSSIGGKKNKMAKLLKA